MDKLNQTLQIRREVKAMVTTWMVIGMMIVPVFIAIVGYFMEFSNYDILGMVLFTEIISTGIIIKKLVDRIIHLTNENLHLEIERDDYKFLYETLQ